MMYKQSIIATLALAATTSCSAFLAPQAPRTSTTSSLEAVNRREALAAVGVAAASTLLPQTASAAKKKNRDLGRVFLKGKATLKDGVEIPIEFQDAKNKVLYITAKPVKADTAPPEVIRSAGGQIPAVFFAKKENPTLPFDFELPEAALTNEGSFGLDDDEPYWWEGSTEWEVSVRYDTDGATRTADPSDLVGRTKTVALNDPVCVELTPRGFSGSYFERKQG